MKSGPYDWKKLATFFGVGGVTALCVSQIHKSYTPQKRLAQVRNTVTPEQLCVNTTTVPKKSSI